MKILRILSVLQGVCAHTLFTTLFIDGKNQGDGTCIRMPIDDDTATSPVEPITGMDMACGRDGGGSIPFICPASSGSTLTFEFRAWPGAQQQEAIDGGHKGPCSVYLKKVNDMFSDSAAGFGWFKIWEDGYDAEKEKWCVDTLIKNNGLLSVKLPKGLPNGYYLVRPEILALHQAYRGDPQFYLGCAQIFINDGSAGHLDIPDEYQVSIPGYVDLDTPGVKFDIYQKSMPSYPFPGPKVFRPSSTGAPRQMKQESSLLPEDCLLRNANWCAKPIKAYSGENACWDAVDACYTQSKACWAKVPPTGAANCYVWQRYCRRMESACDSRDFEGPPKFQGIEAYAAVPGEIPAPYNETPVSKTDQADDTEDDSGDGRELKSVQEAGSGAKPGKLEGDDKAGKHSSRHGRCRNNRRHF